jgi:hypothetical protein
MTTWRDMAPFAGVDIEDSFVLRWELCGECLVIDVEASLWPGHPSYEQPINGNHTCYKPARLVFPSVREVSGLRSMPEVVPSRDPDGSPDYETIDTLEGAGFHYQVIGDFGTVSLQCDPPTLTITSETQCGAG